MLFDTTSPCNSFTLPMCSNLDEDHAKCVRNLVIQRIRKCKIFIMWRLHKGRKRHIFMNWRIKGRYRDSWSGASITSRWFHRGRKRQRFMKWSIKGRDRDSWSGASITLRWLQRRTWRGRWRQSHNPYWWGLCKSKRIYWWILELWRSTHRWALTTL